MRLSVKAAESTQPKTPILDYIYSEDILVLNTGRYDNM